MELIKEPMEIAIARVVTGILSIGTIGILWALAQELRAGHWWISFLCLGLLAIVSVGMMRVVTILIEWKRMQKEKKA